MAGPSTRHAPRARRADLLAISGLLLLGVALPVLIGAIAGSLDASRLDDWAYRRIAMDLAGTGRLSLGVRTTIVGQILLVQPFLWLSSLQPWGFTVAGILFAAAGVLGVYALARQFLPPLRAVVPALLVLAFPGYLAYVTSYMSDVPALAAQGFALALGAVALGARPVRGRWLVASVIVGCIGMSIRDFALAAPASVLFAVACVEPRRRRTWVLAFAVAACYALLTVIRIALYPAGLAVEIASGGLFQAMQGLALVALVLSPAVLIGAPAWRPFWHRLDVLVGAELGVVIVVLRVIQWVRQGSMPLMILPSIASQWGVPQRQMFLGDRPLLFDDTAWAILNLAALAASIPALAAGFGIAGAYLRAARRSPRRLAGMAGTPAGLLAVFAGSVAAGLTAYGILNPVFDRYFWLLVPPLAVLLLHVPAELRAGASAAGPAAPAAPASRVPAAASAPMLAVLGAIAMVFALNSNAFDAALWRAGDTLVGLGVRADQVDAGYSWVGYYASTPLTGGGTGTVRYRLFWPQFRQCGSVTSTPSPEPGTVLVATRTYALYLVAGPAEPLYLFRSTDPACAQAGVVTQ